MTVSFATLAASARRQQQAMLEGAYDSVALTAAYLDAIQLNPALNAYITVDREGALAAARTADRDRAAGQVAPLLGIPIGVKDIIDVAGLPTTYGSAAFAGNIAARDAPAIERLRTAGAVILGKTNTLEFAFGWPSPVFGDSVNPRNNSRVAGGSSNGSATAVAANLCSIAIGTDTAGSIRIPSAYCGIFGLKPTFGTVPLDGVGVLASSMDTVGPMARSMDDLDVVMRVLEGRPARPLTGTVSPRVMARPRFGFPRDWFPELLSPEVATVWHNTIETVRRAKFDVVPVDLPSLTDVPAIWYALAAAEASAWHAESLGNRSDCYGEGPRRMLKRMATLSPEQYADAKRARDALQRRLEAAFQGVDALIVPATATAAFTHEEAAAGRVRSGQKLIDINDAATACTRPFNVTGHPAIVVPAQLGSDRLTIAMQVVGKFNSEVALIDHARVVSSLCSTPFGS